MSKVCCECGKFPGFGKKVRRQGKNAQNRRVFSRVSRRFLPNLQRVTVCTGSNAKKVWMCASCIKKGRKGQSS